MRKLIFALISVLLVLNMLSAATRASSVAATAKSSTNIVQEEPLSYNGWPMFHQNLMRTGYSNSTAPDTNNILWSYTKGSPLSSPAVADDMVFTGCGNSVCALDEATGSEIWSYTTSGAVYSPAVAGGIVYAGSEDYNVYALNEATGTRIWNYTTGGQIKSSPAISDGTLYIGSDDEKVYALNASTGTLTWIFKTLDSVESSPAVADGMVFIGSNDHNVYALQASTGALVWEYITGEYVWSVPTVTDGMVFIGSNDGNVYALNETTGTKTWSYDTEFYVISSPAVADGMVFMGQSGVHQMSVWGGAVFALNETTGTEIWSYSSDGYDFTSSPAVADGKVFVGSNDNFFHALNETTGTEIWNYTNAPEAIIGGYPMWSSAAIADGAVFVGYMDGTLYAFGPPPSQIPPTVRISPQSITSFRFKNDNFTVYVQVDNATAIDAAQVQFTYDPTVLNVTQVVEGPFLPSAGTTVVAQAYAEENWMIEPPTGEVFYSSAITGTGALTGASGSGVLLNVTFRVVSEGVTPLHLLFHKSGTGGAGTYFLNNESSEVGPELRDASFQPAPIGPIHIKADGSIEPKEIRAHIPISTVDNVTYTFTSDIENASIVVERDNVTVDGAGYTLQSDESGVGVGFTLSNLRNVTIENTKIMDFGMAIYLEATFQSVISGNAITGGYWGGGERGIALYSSSDNRIVGNNVTQIQFGVSVFYSSNRNNITQNTVTNCAEGIELYQYEYPGGNPNHNGNNYLYGNNLTNNYYDGIVLTASYGNRISGNYLAGSQYGIGLYRSSSNNNITNNTFVNDGSTAHDVGLYSSSNNSFYHNNFIGNGEQVYSEGSPNTWDNGYPSGGNYWSDYNGTDLYSGQHQNVTGSDGIGDTPYVIDANNTDDYPLMGAFSDFNVAWGVDVQVVSNSTVSDFQFNGTAILFNVSGVNGTTGFCNVYVSTALLNGTLTVLVNGTQIQYSLLPSLNSTQTYLYFTYGHSTEQVIIMPEFPDSLILAMFILATLLAITIYKKRYSRSIRG